MNILFIGDIVGKSGRRAVAEALPRLLGSHKIDVIVANAENAAGGFGLTPRIRDELMSARIDLLTSGNHIWDKKDILELLDKEDGLLRPANYPDDVPGHGSAILHTKTGKRVGVINLSGRIFMENIDCPFQVALREVEKIRKITPIIIVDFHAEATSEKEALGWFLDGRVSAVFGTHTHVQTADATILPKGTAYITDVGMSGAFDSVIGFKKEIAIERFLTQVPIKFELAKKNIHLQGAIVSIDDETGESREIQRIDVAV
ncbi:MAG: TIGR00282 family metallophosphoesterase [Deltaproteobacteria bacterium]|nr:TIGR00282 family metallophosphoesterase [Deltaproteobacteria bacterium]